MRFYRVGQKPKQDKIQIAQGERSRRVKEENENYVLFLCSKGYTFDQLKLESEFSRQTLAKHLKRLEGKGLIYRDTIKPWDERNTVAICWSKIPDKPYTFSDVDEMARRQQKTGNIVFRFLSNPEFTAC
jgi:hypothetical protein